MSTKLEAQTNEARERFGEGTPVPANVGISLRRGYLMRRGYGIDSRGIDWRYLTTVLQPWGSIAVKIAQGPSYHCFERLQQKVNKNFAQQCDSFTLPGNDEP